VERTNRDRQGTGRGEAEALELIGTLLAEAPAGQVWTGDDAAVVPCGGERLLLTVDTVVEGIHADFGLIGLDDFGWRAVSTAASDIAAMGGLADELLVAVAGPPETDLGSLYCGIVAAAGALGVPVVGGELSTAPVVVVTVTVVGRMPGGTEPVLRSGAQPGDHVFVTGPVGGAAAGLRFLRSTVRSGPGLRKPEPAAGIVERHRRPVARLAEGTAARSAGARGMIDVSDGFAADLGKLAESSGVGIELDSVPVADGADEEEALCGGDDYELLFCAPDPQVVLGTFAAAGLRAPEIVGRCTAEAGELRLNGAELRRCGYEHPWVIPTTTD
jgi:thiamine-monophosphate kinase